MSPMVRIVRKVNVHASRNWLVTAYIAVIVTLILALAISEALH